jgi:arylsulfatase A-like enzyme
LWSDHGWHLGEKDHWHKSTLWEEATRVPLIIDAPGFASGVCSHPVSLIDLYPTLNELCGLEPVDRQDGVSLLPLLRDPKRSWDRPAVIEFRSGNAAVRSDRYRYIRYRDGGEELYDHQTDAHEWHNLAGSAAHAGVKAELAQWLPRDWAQDALTKQAFDFDPETFQWTHKATGRVVSGVD